MHVTPFGADGPRAGWRATDLGVMASSGNMWATGDPDRAPVACTLASSYAHCGGEVAFAALSGLWSRTGEAGRGQGRVVDCSMQEIVFVANMVAIAGFKDNGQRGQRTGAILGRTQEIWPTRDGFVSYGVRGGAARLKNWDKLAELLVAEGIPGAAVLTTIDWTTFNNANASDEELDAIQAPLGEWFSRHTSQELYDLACEFNLFLAPAMSPREMLVNVQLESRDFFAPLGGCTRFPHRFVVTTSADGEAAPTAATVGAPTLGSSEPTWDGEPSSLPATGADYGTGSWAGVNILEFGSGAAGPHLDSLLRRARRHGAANRVGESPRLPPRHGPRAEQPAWPRRFAVVRRAQRRQAQRHVQPEGPTAPSTSSAG